MEDWEIELSKLIDAAKSENWEYVDTVIPQIKNNERYYNWAFNQGIKDENDKVRDLGVSIIEKAKIAEQYFSEMREPLYGLMLNDRHMYVQFRAAFALANHGPGAHKEEVLSKLNEAKMDKDVCDIAKTYIKKMRSKRVVVS